jgi:hypothetical protein
MQRAIRLSLRAKGAVVAVIVAGCAAGAGAASCVTAAPPDVTQPPPLGPIIIQDAVQPPANAYVTAIPPDAQFIVPVRVFDPSQSVECEVFIDFDPGPLNNTGSGIGTCVIQPGLDAGVTEANFTVSPSDLGDPNACHTIQCFVANSFQQKSAHTPGITSLGADSVVWQYTPNGPGGCDEFDAGDGAFPPADAPTDTLPVTPDAVVH